MLRLDQALVARALVHSRSAAVRHIQAGEVLVNGRPVQKVATKVSEKDQVKLVVSGPQYASRAGHKLVGAFEKWPQIEVQGRRCLDAGASTGGFTDVLLQRDASHVIAVDVGHDQLITRLREHDKVQVIEGLNIRYLTLDDIATPVDLVVSDLSFISLRLVMKSLSKVTKVGGELLLMVKPQFEVGRKLLPKTGVVQDPEQRRASVVAVVEEAVRCFIEPRGLAESPLPGQDGNKEFFLWGTLSNEDETCMTLEDIERWVDRQSIDWSDNL